MIAARRLIACLVLAGCLACVSVGAARAQGISEELLRSQDRVHKLEQIKTPKSLAEHCQQAAAESQTVKCRGAYIESNGKPDWVFVIGHDVIAEMFTQGDSAVVCVLGAIDFGLEAKNLTPCSPMHRPSAFKDYR